MSEAWLRQWDDIPPEASSVGMHDVDPERRPEERQIEGAGDGRAIVSMWIMFALLLIAMEIEPAAAEAAHAACCQLATVLTAML